MWHGNSFVFESSALGYRYVLMVAIHMTTSRTSNYFRMHFTAIRYHYNGQHFFPHISSLLFKIGRSGKSVTLC